MLPRAYRIGAQHFSALRKDGKNFHAPHLSVRVLSVSVPLPRFAVSVSKKIDTRAVVRNKIRRRSYAALRKLVLEEKRAISPALYVFYPKPGITDLSPEQLKAEISSLIKKRQ